MYLWKGKVILMDHQEQNNYYQPQNLQNAGATFATVSMILGMGCMFSFLTVYLPLVFGSLSIIFALLSKGYGKKLLISAKIGLCTAIGCIGLIIVIMGTFITLFLSSSRSDMIRLGQQMDQQLEDQFGISPDEILGQSYEDIMEDFADSLGKPVSPY